MTFDRPLFLFFLLVPLLVWWWLRPPVQGRPWLTYRLELWQRAARELGLLEPRASTLKTVPLLLAALALVLAGAGPRLGRAPGPERLLVLLDRSPSMGARDNQGRTRLERALEKLWAEIAGLPPGVEMRVLLAGGERLGLEIGQTGSLQEWKARLAGLIPARSGPAGLADLVAGLEALGSPVLVLTDLAGPERALAERIDHAHLRVVGEPVDNGALLDLVLAPTWPAPEVQGIALVRSGGGQRVLEVRASSSGELLDQVPLAEGQSGLVEAPLSWSRHHGPVEIRLLPPDRFALDDALQLAPLPPPALRVAVRSGDPAEEPSVLARAAAHALATGQGRVVTEEQQPDLIVVEGGRLPAWPEPPRPGWLLLGTAVAGATGEALLEAPEPGAWEARHPLLEGLDLSQLGIDRALASTSIIEGGRVLLRAISGEPLLVATESEPRIVHLLFLPQGSSLAAELLWPRFLHRCLAWFARTGVESEPAQRPGGAAPDLEESQLDPGPAPPERPLPAFARAGASLDQALLLAALVLLGLWLVLLAPGPGRARLSFSPPRG